MLVRKKKHLNSYLLKDSSSGINEDFSKNYVRITIKIPHMKTGFNWRRFTREVKNGSTTKATYHGTYVILDLLLLSILLI